MFCVCRDSQRSDKSGLMQKCCSMRCGKTRRKTKSIKITLYWMRVPDRSFCIRWSSCHCDGPNLYVYVAPFFLWCGYNKPRNTYKFLSHFIARWVTLINSLFVMDKISYAFFMFRRGESWPFFFSLARAREKPLQTKDAYFFVSSISSSADNSHATMPLWSGSRVHTHTETVAK